MTTLTKITSTLLLGTYMHRIGQVPTSIGDPDALTVCVAHNIITDRRPKHNHGSDFPPVILQVV